MRTSFIRHIIPFLLFTFFSAVTTSGAFASQKLAEIKKDMIRQSIASYPGNCPCPYHSARNGHRCGKRSAYSRAGGYSVLCYDSDISDNDAKNWQQRYPSRRQ